VNYAAATPVPQTLTVVRANPLAVTGGPYKVFFGQNFSPDAGASQPSYNESITTYEWDLNNDNNFADASGAAPTISYANLTGTWGMVAGPNTIQLKVTDSASKTSIVSTTVTIILSFTWDANGATASQTDGAGAWLDANKWWDGSANVNWLSGSSAIFGNGGVGGAVTLASPTIVNSLTFNSYITTGYTVGTASQTITLNAGITKNAGGVAATIISPITLGGAQTWTNNSSNTLNTTGTVNLGANTLTFGGSGNFSFAVTGTSTISGTGGIIKNGTGILTLSAGGTAQNHSYTGTTTINGGTVVLGGGNKPTGNFNLNGGMLTDYFQSTYAWTSGLGAGNNQIQIYGDSGFGGGNGASTWRIGTAGSVLTWGSTHFNPTTLKFMTAADNLGPSIYGTAVLDNGLDLGAAARTIDVLNASANPATSGARINGVISNGSLIKTGGGNLVLNSAANTYAGTTMISAGFLSVATLANGGSNSSIGSSSAAASNLLLGNGATFRYTGGAVSTNRSFTINGTTAGHGAALDASGSGAVNFTEIASPAYGTVDQTRTLTLTGTNTGNNILAALLTNNGSGVVSLTKSGTGTWNLSNAGNNYTGPTTLAGGILQGSIPGGLGTVGGTSALIFNGGVLGLTGDFTRSLGSNTTVTAVNFTGAGGWAAYGADRNVNLGGAASQVVWATPNTGFNGQTLILGNAAATHKVTLQNDLDLGTAVRTVQTDDGTGAVDGELSGIITGSAGGGLTKTGAGVLSLTNANTYIGVTTVNAGVLLLNNANALPGGIANSGGSSALVFTGGVLGLGNGNFERSLGTNTTATAVNFTNAGGWAAYGADRIVNLGGASTPITWATANTGFNNQTLILSAASATHTVDLQNPLLVTTMRTVQVDNGSAVIDAKFSGNISGTGGGISKTGSGTLNISGNMSQTGGLTVSTTSGSTLILSGTNTYSGTTINAFSNPTSGSLIFQGMQAVSNSTTLQQTHGGGVGGFGPVKFLDDSAAPASKTGFGLSMIATNTSHGMSVFVGNNNTSNGGSSAGTTTGSTISLGNLSIGQGANNEQLPASAQ
jgi:fibronectin-binding autotransporter adhesin